MRRLGAVTQFVGWCHLRYNRAHITDTEIQLEVRKAIRQLCKKDPPTWVAISRVSSLLSEETREALSDAGGLAGFCSSPRKPSETPFSLGKVDGVLCVRLHEERRGPPPSSQGVVKTMKQKSLNEESELCRVCSVLPERAAPLAACQRVWKLPTIKPAAEYLASLMKQVESILVRHKKACTMPLYVQVGYRGRQAEFVSIGPQAMLRENKTNTNERGDAGVWEVGDFSPQYDLWRISRYLRTDTYVPIDEVMRFADGVLQTPLMQVVMSYPERIFLHLGGAISLDSADEERFYVNGDTCNEIREVFGVKFLLSEEEVSRNLLSFSPKLSNLTDEELQLERLKLKDISPFRRQKGRRAIVREEFRRRYPKGNVFLNPNVVAIHIYDQMTPGVWVNNSVVRETMLPDGGRGSMHVGVDFFDQFTHLFITQSVTTTSVNVMRREQGMENVPSDAETSKGVSFSDEEVLLFLLPRLTNKKEDWGDKTVEVLATLLPRHVFKSLQARGGAKSRLTTILRQYPEAFELIQTGSSGNRGEECVIKVHLRHDEISKLGVKLVSKLQVSEKNEKLIRDKNDLSDKERKEGGGDSHGAAGA